VIVGRRAQGNPDPTSPRRVTPLDLDLALELGRDLRFATDGLEARLAGRVQVTSGRRADHRQRRHSHGARHLPRSGSGSRSNAARHLRRPLANPSLDVVALRKNLTVEAGVEIRRHGEGAADPPHFESAGSRAEKLSRLAGPAELPEAAAARESAALQAASAALLAPAAGR
jgi:autotransporter translocation and assembly factor TamB